MTKQDELVAKIVDTVTGHAVERHKNWGAMFDEVEFYMGFAAAMDGMGLWDKVPPRFIIGALSHQTMTPGVRDYTDVEKMRAHLEMAKRIREANCWSEKGAVLGDAHYDHYRRMIAWADGEGGAYVGLVPKHELRPDAVEGDTHYLQDESDALGYIQSDSEDMEWIQ